MAATELEVLGADRLMREMRHLGGKGARRVVQAGIRAGLSSLVKSIQAQVPPHVKSVRRSIGKKFDLRKNVAKVGINVGKRKTRKKKNKQTGETEIVSNKSFVPHAAVYVTGSGPRFTQSGAYRGRMRGTPVVERGVQAGEAKAETAVRSKIDERLRIEAGKVG